MTTRPVLVTFTARNATGRVTIALDKIVAVTENVAAPRDDKPSARIVTVAGDFVVTMTHNEVLYALTAAGQISAQEAPDHLDELAERAEVAARKRAARAVELANLGAHDGRVK